MHLTFGGLMLLATAFLGNELALGLLEIPDGEIDETCPGNQQFSTCGGCLSTCEDRYVSKFCTLQCRIGCTCPYPMLLHGDNCVKHEECPEYKCGPDHPEFFIGNGKFCKCRELLGDCTREYRPVCDNEGKKWSNLCRLCQEGGRQFLEGKSLLYKKDYFPSQDCSSD
ncbi:unnamed protein product [Clavelina lepadiformis]|uniref:Uncharacterized protein n=1 Tax=Clavelina lepadiformis TaxID=159417 RepID=A0ABP0GK98_CLALP